MENKYLEKALAITDKMGVTLEILSVEYKKHFVDDIVKRCVFKCQLKKGGKKYIFNFGQSIASGMEKPNMHDVMTCMTKCDPGSFESFCYELDYPQYNEKTGRKNKASEKVYLAVVKEYEGMCRLFTEEELEQLHEIQ